MVHRLKHKLAHENDYLLIISIAIYFVNAATWCFWIKKLFGCALLEIDESCFPVEH